MRNQSSLPEEDSRSGFPPAGAPTFASSPTRIRRIGKFLLIIAPALARPELSIARGLPARLPLPALNYFSASADFAHETPPHLIPTG